MLEPLDRDFARFVEKNAEVLKMIANESAADIETLWKVLVYIFDFNYLAVYEINHRDSSYEFYKSPIKEIPILEDYVELIDSAIFENRAKSLQKEEETRNGMLLVEALAAIPFVIDQTQKILIICKQMEKSKAEVISGYEFDGYKLQLYLSVIKNFVRVHESKRQITAGKLATIALGIFASLEGLGAIIGILKGSSVLDITEGFVGIMFLIFVVAVSAQLWTSKKGLKLNKMIKFFTKLLKRQK